MILTVDSYRFDFPNAQQAYKFDEKDKLSPFYHGVDALKAVDVMVEFPNEYIYVEIKTYDDLNVFNTQDSAYNTNEPRKYLIHTLSRKYRETYLYRMCEGKIDKPIYYICLMNLDSALKSYCRKELAKHIPVGKANKNRWHKMILDESHLFIVDEEAWNRNANMLRWGTCKFIG